MKTRMKKHYYHLHWEDDVVFSDPEVYVEGKTLVYLKTLEAMRLFRLFTEAAASKVVSFAQKVSLGV